LPNVQLSLVTPPILRLAHVYPRMINLLLPDRVAVQLGERSLEILRSFFLGKRKIEKNLSLNIHGIWGSSSHG